MKAAARSLDMIIAADPVKLCIVVQRLKSPGFVIPRTIQPKIIPLLSYLLFLRATYRLQI